RNLILTIIYFVFGLLLSAFGCVRQENTHECSGTNNAPPYSNHRLDLPNPPPSLSGLGGFSNESLSSTMGTALTSAVVGYNYYNILKDKTLNEELISILPLA
nr:hypothetical protein [Tanacetum cinerariifolium]